MVESRNSSAISRAEQRGQLYGQTAGFGLPELNEGHQVWQESFKGMALWSAWMIWQKINYIHANRVKAD